MSLGETADGADRIVLHLLQDAIVRAAMSDLDRPHVLVIDSDGDLYVDGPYPNWVAALSAADQQASQLDEVADRLQIRVAPLCDPA